VDRFADRFDPAQFADDEPVIVRVGGHTRHEVSVAEGIFSRLRALATAYNLHVLRDVVTPYSEVTLVPAQAEGALDELEFLAEVVRDPIVVENVAILQRLFAEAARTNASLTVDWDI
jgi:hypothetical protein